MMIRDRIKKDIKKQMISLASKWGGPLARGAREVSRIEVMRTVDGKFGDFSTNVALRFRSRSPTSKHSPMVIARILANSLKSQPYIEKLEVAGPGFINFYIKASFWQEQVSDVLTSRSLGVNKAGFKPKKVIVEFTDPNPFKEFHIGHLYSNIVGESICRLLEAKGAKVWRVNYQGDVGMHVAKTIWAMPKLLHVQGESLTGIEKKPLGERVFFLGQAYSLGAKDFEASDEVKKEVTEINKKVFKKNNELMEFYEKGRKWSLDYFEEIYRRLGTKFDHYYFESEVGIVGVELVHKYLGKVFIESEGAIIFPGEKHGLHNRVFINSQGLPTYEAKELGLAPTKYKDFAYDESLIVTGSEINEYFKVVLAALEQIFPDLAAKTRHIGHGMVRMPGGKISSRLGNVILGEWLLDEAKKRVVAAFTGVSDSLAEQIGTGAVKYAFLKGSIGQDINFSFEESISLSGNSGPYLQYTYARCQSVLAKASQPVILSPKDEESKHRSFAKAQDDNKGEDEEQLLLRALGHFEEVIFDAATAYSPNVVANFLYEVAQKYNTLYNNLPILKASYAERSRRLFLTRATADILQKGLHLLGISAPEKM